MRFPSRNNGNSKYYIDSPAMYFIQDKSNNIYKKEYIKIIGGEKNKEYEIEFFQ